MLSLLLPQNPLWVLGRVFRLIAKFRPLTKIFFCCVLSSVCDKLMTQLSLVITSSVEASCFFLASKRRSNFLWRPLVFCMFVTWVNTAAARSSGNTYFIESTALEWSAVSAWRDQFTVNYLNSFVEQTLFSVPNDRFSPLWINRTTAFLIRRLPVVSKTGRIEYQLLLVKATDRGRNVKF